MLRQAIQGISDLILVPGLINLDFADVKTIMSGMGLAMMGTGMAEGKDRAVDAARRAISSPLLEGASVNGARGVIINVTGGTDLSLIEVSDASTIVQEAAHEDANIIFGAVVDPGTEGQGQDHRHRDRLRARPPSVRPVGAPADTPVDMSAYTEHPRVRHRARVRMPAPGSRSRAGRRSICPRPRPGEARSRRRARQDSFGAGYEVDGDAGDAEPELGRSTSRRSCAGRRGERVAPGSWPMVE